ncbi:MAG TPA: T9SS type A sorting domain-containing protein [Bacteroidales bacterium]|nr:T9SS type A sorting domain-containing protein [Bacteroidales bacterium]HNS46509.1 T9SS type A sorting domain-containing protein [Bacteroidales bacterium]
MKHPIITLVLVISIALSSQAQSLLPEVIASAGDVFTGKSGSVSWTLGETIIETVSSETSLLTQGFHQSYLQVLKVDAPEDPLVDVTVYPNPVNDLLTIEITTVEKDPQISLELFDFTGQQIYEQTIRSQTLTEQLDVSRFSSSLFILRVVNLKSHRTESFKIHKINF